MNYNIKINLLKLKGAEVVEVDGRRKVVIPINNRTGTVQDAYYIEDKRTGERKEKPCKGCYLNLTAFDLRDPKFGQSHLVKPALSREVMERLSQEQLRLNPFIGNLQPWNMDENKK